MAVRAEAQIDLARVDDGSPGAPGQNGATFIPSVDVAGDISWTNDGGLPNPPTQNIMGPPGTSGPSITDVKTQYYLSTSDSTPTGGSWDDTPQEFEHGYYYWTRDYTTYSDSTYTTSTPVYNQGLTLANEYALSAANAADDAQEQASAAYNSASLAIGQLSVVEDIVGVLDLIQKNGEYELTQDKTPQTDKWYFTRSGSGTVADPYIYELAPTTYNYVLTSDVAIDPDKTYYTRTGSGTSVDPYVYTPVDEPDVADIGTYYEFEGPAALGYYELIGVNQAIQNYVSSHLALDNQGLSLQNGATRLLLSTTDGLLLYDQNGNIIAQYGSETVIGSGAYKVRLTPTALIFVDNNVDVASISGQELKISNARVDHSMRMGHFIWTVSGDGRLILRYSEE